MAIGCSTREIELVSLYILNRKHNLIRCPTGARHETFWISCHVPLHKALEYKAPPLLSIYYNPRCASPCAVTPPYRK